MSKNKAKQSAAQRDKNNIAVAKTLKKSGIISKQAKLHSGAYISKGVLRKVRLYEEQAKLGYRAVPVSKAVAKAAQEHGFQVIGGNKIVGPATRQFANRLAKGELTGVRPVRGGFMEEVILPHTVYDLKSLEEQLASGIDNLKLPEEQFAFKYKGWESYQPFMNTQQMLEYLRHYKGIFEPGLSGQMKAEELQEEFANLSIFRLHPNATRQNIRGADQRRKDRAADRAAGLLPVTIIRKRKPLSEKLAEMNPDRAERIRKKMREKSIAKREAERNDPERYRKQLEKGRARAMKSYKLKHKVK